MTNQELYDTAYAEATKSQGYSISTGKMRAAIEQGIVDGDSIYLGGNLVATIKDGIAMMADNGKPTGALAISAMTEAQHDRMIVRKAISSAQVGYAPRGSIKI